MEFICALNGDRAFAPAIKEIIQRPLYDTIKRACDAHHEACKQLLEEEAAAEARKADEAAYRFSEFKREGKKKWPGLTARIVELKETIGLSFGAIPRRLKKEKEQASNDLERATRKTWTKPDGTPLSVDYVKKRYQRRPR